VNRARSEAHPALALQTGSGVDAVIGNNATGTLEPHSVLIKWKLESGQPQSGSIKFS